MSDDIRLLEDRVHRAVDRLGRLHDQRNQLHDEVRTLQSRLDNAEQVKVRDDVEGTDRQAWRAEKADVVAAVREAIKELRGD
jgi:hypothetical protein